MRWARAASSAPGKLSMTSTGVPASTRACARLIDQGVAPRIASPGRSPSVRPSLRASGASVKPCSTMVAAISAKTDGITSAPSAMPPPTSLALATPATAAATMPRGAIQAASARSCQVRPLAEGGEQDRDGAHHEQHRQRQEQDRPRQLREQVALKARGQRDEKGRHDEDDERLPEARQLVDAGDAQVGQRDAEDSGGGEPPPLP